MGELVLKDGSWKDALADVWTQPWFLQIKAYLQAEKAAGKILYPPLPLVFNALDSTPLDRVKVVILGQDPYHGSGQAHGLAFSVPKGVRPPPSLKNIFKELQRDLGLPPPSGGCLQRWAGEGVLLLNTSLSVEGGQAGSHARIGWDRFTDRVIKTVSDQHRPVVFLLWGAHAQGRRPLIDEGRHLVLETSHPSPLSARRGFLGCGHFSAANAFLEKNGQAPVTWQVD